MSGQKTSYVRIEEREARRLREMETHFRAVQRDLPETMRQLKNEMQSQLERQRERTDAKLKDFEQATNNLKSDLAEAERRQQKSLRNGLRKVQQQMSEQIGAERDAREQQARAMQTEYRALVAEERSERQRQMRAIEDRLTNIENREQKLTQMASGWLDDLRIVMAEVGKLQHERFAPGKWQRISMRVEQAEDNLRQGASEAALGGAQNCYLDLIELRAEVLYQEQLFEQAFMQALQAVKSLLAEVEAHQEATVYPQGENEFNFKVNFWSGGKLEQVSGGLNAIERRLESEKETLSIEQVQALEKDADALRAKMLEAVETAKIAIINSQACYNVSQVVEEILAQQGYEVADGVYEGEDQRGAYGLKMKNRGGDEVVTLITPSAERELEYQMQMNFFDRSQDEPMRQNFVKAVQNGLNEAGLQSLPSQTTRDVGEPDEAVRDFESFRRRRSALERVRG
ncbi:MAG: hypothetical protein M3384_07720 [Acidobacteriota bacterium]|nr:hypothetical protein [Acidobacteriota bacterium]